MGHTITAQTQPGAGGQYLGRGAGDVSWQDASGAGPEGQSAAPAAAAARRNRRLQQLEQGGLHLPHHGSAGFAGGPRPGVLRRLLGRYHVGDGGEGGRRGWRRGWGERHWLRGEHLPQLPEPADAAPVHSQVHGNCVTDRRGFLFKYSIVIMMFMISVRQCNSIKNKSILTKSD